MSRNKQRKKKREPPDSQKDFTLDESANAVKLPSRTRKPNLNSIVAPELTWDQIADYDVEVTLNENGVEITKIQSKPENKKSSDESGVNWYPEVVWYLISNYIRPEYVGTFALINRHTYAITKSESFWRKLYSRYCKKRNVPVKLRLENDYKTYGLQQRVVRALYHSYDLFKRSIMSHSVYSIGQDKRPYELIRRRCINMWYKKEESHWSIYFKFKKNKPNYRINGCRNFLQEMDRIDANDEDSCKVLEITCDTVNINQPLIGLTLASLNITLSQNFRKHKLQLGFTSSEHNVCKEIIPEIIIEINEVTSLSVMDWWHPYYPHSEGSIPLVVEGEEMQVLNKDFFS